MSTVGSELRRLFPHGTNPASEDASEPDWSQRPFVPADVFTAAAHLLETSGAYQYIVAPYSAASGGDPRYGYDSPTAAPLKVELERWIDIGRRWARRPDVGEEVQPFWDILYACEAEKLVLTPSARAPSPRWWSACHAMLVIADEASGDFGYDYRATQSTVGEADKWANWLAGYALADVTERRPIPSADHPGNQDHYSRHVSLDSLCTDVDRHVARVFPKGRTTEIGCTLRTFSHNLTLLPPHGRANAYWHQSVDATEVDNPDALTILVIPFPYVIPERSFHGCETDVGAGEQRWGRFQLDQRWLRPDGSALPGHDEEWSTTASRQAFADFVEAMLAKVRADGDGPIQGIVLPELSLDWETYDTLIRRLCRNWPSIEFVVAGVSQDCNGRVGNQVTASVFRPSPSDGRRIAETHSRRKHHRWQIDRTQIESYGIEGDLDPEVLWWEHHSVEERVLHLDVFREGSAMTAVICEDLARVDPGLALLRSLGPNLVFALLMDGPQLKFRWPGTYATALADDPGSSVLSITCAGMVDRSNATFKARNPTAAPQRTVALWKNRSGPASVYPPGDFAEINLPDGSHGLVLKLAGTRAHETTMDGRPNTDTTAWHLRGVTPVAIEAAVLDAQNLRWIVPN
ncbi:hypothetical protein M6G65_06945 [Methylobacterium tardum]|uniref:hypothetical protein n=1 Tax=Methylobacterium tardum TaxID=374432 RepID=UPI002020B612|nr:hypothetical protein [Methylobacterium tardum]URD38191.1 hypothetical protein M6G65_06945 [Methylobacterium tardum]